MWKPQSDSVRAASGPAAAAVLCTVLAQCMSTRQSEVISEMLCWIILPILCRLAKRSDAATFSSRATLSGSPGHQSASRGALWIIAGSVAIACLSKSENSGLGLFPALTPLLVAAQKQLSSKSHPSKKSDSWSFTPLVSTVWGTALSALFATLTQTTWDLRGSVTSIVPVTALLVVYVAFIHRTPKSARFIPFINIEEDISSLSWRIVSVLILALVVEFIFLGFPRCELVYTLLLGLTKALSWYFTIRIAGNTSWPIAPTIGTFSLLSTRDPFTQSSDVQALSHVLASLLVIGQVIYMLPKHARAKSALWVFSLLSLGPYLANIYAIQRQSTALSKSTHFQKHPVEVLIHEANASFNSLVERQSKTYAAACDEYRRRYSVDPPPGFEAWYRFAVSNQSPIIDDFDTIYERISPFWKLSGADIAKIISNVQDASDNELWLCGLEGETVKIRCKHSYRNFDRHIGASFDKLFGDLHRDHPDFKILSKLKVLVNHLDEPRVLIPPQTPVRGGVDGSKPFNLTDLSRRPTWEAITKFCRPRRSDSEFTDKRYGVPFVADRPSALDLCQHPEFSDMHGLFVSPTSFHLVEGLVPILSTGSPSTMGDILFPSPAYMEPEFQYDDTHDIEWDRKKNNLYWAGSTTGGYATDGRWGHYHRQRFVKLTQNIEPHQYHYLQEENGIIKRILSSFLNSRLYDVAFTKIFQCERKHCRDQYAYFNVKSWEDKDRAMKSRLVFDVDGNGISGRYYKLLASRSVPLKQTVFREWHDDRLLPWVHYVPVSQSMEELPELVLFLTSTELGQQRAKEIAEHGRDWFSKAFRDVDLSIYTFRLLLEMARLQDLDRQAG